LRPVDNTEAERPRGLGFVEAPGAKRMAEYLTRAVMQHQIGIISGPTGSGKTVRARAWRWAQDDPREVSIVPIYEGEGDVKAAVKTLCLAFGIPCDRSGPESRRAEIVYTLRHYPRSRAVILDEAQFLTRPAVGHLRQLVHDEAGVALILMGDTRLPDLLKGLDAVNGRALHPFFLPAFSPADVRAMAEADRELELWLKKKWRVDSLRFLDASTAPKVITALLAMEARAKAARAAQIVFRRGSRAARRGGCPALQGRAPPTREARQRPAERLSPRPGAPTIARHHPPRPRRQCPAIRCG